MMIETAVTSVRRKENEFGGITALRRSAQLC